MIFRNKLVYKLHRCPVCGTYYRKFVKKSLMKAKAVRNSCCTKCEKGIAFDTVCGAKYITKDVMTR